MAAVGKLAALIALAALMTGCGSDGDEGPDGSTVPPSSTATSTPAPDRIWPKPSNTPEDVVAKLAAASEAHDCGGRLFHAGTLPRRACDAVVQGLDPGPPVEVFGSGAVARNGPSGAVILALDRDRRFKLATRFDSTPPTVPVKRADDAMAYAVSALRRGDCADLRRVSLVFERDFCGRPSLRALRAALREDYSATPELLGGNGRFAFYGLRTKHAGYFTLLFTAHDRRGYAFVEGYRGG